ncbi:N-acetyltransferase [Kitasatospora sp. NE20-6]|uniref:GNAT family N-acetyltransferase n=1 Tax=Kitasatospora sp. NE20-6 TaxID=2859066 RepID=UPI0034DBE1E5
MTWTLTHDPAAFRAGAGAFVDDHPAENTVLLTVLDRFAKDGPHAYGPDDPLLGWWRSAPDGPVEGAFLRTPPYPLRLGRMPVPAAAGLARTLHAQGVPVHGVGGIREAAEAFAAAWTAADGGVTATVAVDERLHRLAGLVPPDPAPRGRVRPARADDREQLVAWHEAFTAEIAGGRATDHAAAVDHRLADGTLHLWEDGGLPVSFAGVSPVIAGMARIGPVYTPPALRGRGYASGLVAAGSAHALREGASEVLLYTDLANRTSNAIYHRLGYRQVGDLVVLDFTAR